MSHYPVKQLLNDIITEAWEKFPNCPEEIQFQLYSASQKRGQGQGSTGQDELIKTMKKIERRQELLINDVASIKQDLVDIKAVMENQSNITAIRNEMRSLPKFKTVDKIKIFDIKYYKSPS